MNHENEYGPHGHNINFIINLVLQLRQSLTWFGCSLGYSHQFDLKYEDANLWGIVKEYYKRYICRTCVGCDRHVGSTQWEVIQNFD